jgi:N-glycosylase/DNA lyase
MKKYHLPEFLKEKYDLLREPIQSRLNDFSNVPEGDYFYELCFCLCTPQSKAKNALIVQEYLKKKNFQKKPFNPAEILRRPENYIRFHNTKAERLLMARDIYPQALEIIKSKNTSFDIRAELQQLINGFGMKETAHFMRNIGFRNLAILDRHILKHLVNCKVFDEVPKVGTIKNYYEVEKYFIEFANAVSIPLDELDLLFWSYETGEIIK